MASYHWKWFIEYTHPTQAHMYGVERFVYSGETAFQKVEIVDTAFFGRCLILDGKIQSAEYDEYIYHETLIHPAMTMHPEPKKVMIAGGGEGAVLREILKHPSVEHVLMVDIDKEVIDLCRTYLPQWNAGSYDDPKVKLIFEDARKYLEESNDKWDVIFMDLPEPLEDSPCYMLFTREFYSMAKTKLHSNGIIALQAGNLNIRLLECHGAVYNTLKTVFNHVDSYGAYIPSYDTKWGFMCASDFYEASDFLPQYIDDRLKERGLNELAYYDGLTHQHMFTLPKDLRTLRAQETRIIEDDNPLTTY